MSRLLEFPPDMYELDEDEPRLFGHNKDLKRYVEHLKSAMGQAEWRVRRDATAKRFYQSLVGENPEPAGMGDILTIGICSPGIFFLVKRSTIILKTTKSFTGAE
ncbi:hypothetical protein [Agrobacterium cavarae]|uniref:hypothetical protein n=1 Tax=Agrobacterium cavarae TaxID=2528239 RepID=UPI003FD135A1